MPAIGLVGRRTLDMNGSFLGALSIPRTRRITAAENSDLSKDEESVKFSVTPWRLPGLSLPNPNGRWT